VGPVYLLLGTLGVTGRILTSLAFTGVTDSVGGFWVDFGRPGSGVSLLAGSVSAFPRFLPLCGAFGGPVEEMGSSALSL
jgi:hypothetical protein